jgi:hypothetical protein
MARTRLRYSWALHFAEDDPEIQALQGAARWGWRFACELAHDAKRRSREALEGGWDDVALTPADIGRKYGLSPVQVNVLVREAHLWLFGKIRSESGVYYRLRQKKEGRPIEIARTCAEEGCEDDVELGPFVHGNMRYCHLHSSPAARVRRSRRRAAAAESAETAARSS